MMWPIIWIFVGFMAGVNIGFLYQGLCRNWADSDNKRHKS